VVTTASDLARFLVAALAGPRGEPRGRGVLSPAGVRLALAAAPATEGRWGLGYGLGLLPGGDRLAYHEGANRGWRAGLALVPDRRAGIVVLANGDSGSAAIDAVVQQWIALATLVADDASQTPQTDPHVRTGDGSGAFRPDPAVGHEQHR
jgi:CubicO group peptidase (beta-lactamase class C family)